jgi:hypothetical protein
MKSQYVIVFIFCAIGMSYGYWGAFTLSGQSYYDEMAAMTPFFVLVGSAAVFLITIIVWLINKLRKSK